MCLSRGSENDTTMLTSTLYSRFGFEALAKTLTLRPEYSGGSALITLVNTLRQGSDSGPKDVSCLPRSSCPNVKFYDKKTWTAEKKQRDAAAAVGSVEEGSQSNSKKRGRGRAMNGENVAFPFLEDIDGVTISGQDTLIIRDACGAIFNTYVNLGMAPAKYKEGDHRFHDYISHELRSRFACFRYCEGDWKAQKVAADAYWSWWANRGKKMVSKMQESQARIKMDADADISLGAVPTKSEENDPEAVVRKPKRVKHTHPPPV